MASKRYIRKCAVEIVRLLVEAETLSPTGCTMHDGGGGVFATLGLEDDDQEELHKAMLDVVSRIGKGLSE